MWLMPVLSYIIPVKTHHSLHVHVLVARKLLTCYRLKKIAASNVLYRKSSIEAEKLTSYAHSKKLFISNEPHIVDRVENNKFSLLHEIKSQQMKRTFTHTCNMHCTSCKYK